MNTAIANCQQQALDSPDNSPDDRAAALLECNRLTKLVKSVLLYLKQPENVLASDDDSESDKDEIAEARRKTSRISISALKSVSVNDSAIEPAVVESAPDVPPRFMKLLNVRVVRMRQQDARDSCVSGVCVRLFNASRNGHETKAWRAEIEWDDGNTESIAAETVVLLWERTKSKKRIPR